MINCLCLACDRLNPITTKFCTQCGSKLQIQDRYRALKIIGQGGFGKTFLAQDESKPSQPRCVIKQFAFETINPNASQGTLDVAVRLFEQEAKRLDDLGKHPQIPELLSFTIHEGKQYLIQEFIDGETLEQELRRVGAFSEQQVQDVLVEVLQILEFVHSKSVIHRDISPDNIIRRRSDKKLVLVDFGAAKHATATLLAKTGTGIGKPSYGAPEQMLGKSVFQSDLFGLGVTCLHLLTNVEPFTLYDVLENEYQWRQFLNGKTVSDNFEKLLDRLTAYRVKERPTSATEILQELGIRQVVSNTGNTSGLYSFKASELKTQNRVSISPTTPNKHTAKIISSNNLGTRQIICLENSWKETERCISGIDINTGKWVRPVCDDLYPEDGRVSREIRLIQGREPELLDILEIPLANTGKDFGFQSENLSISSGKWKLLGKASPSDLLAYYKDFPYILHNSLKYVSPSEIKALPAEKRHTVQLVQPKRFSIFSSGNSNRKWKGSIELANGQTSENMTITDPVFIKKLDEGYLPNENCLLVVSLNMPWAAPDWKGEKRCWKLIASVIDLTNNNSSPKSSPNPINVTPTIKQTIPKWLKIGSFVSIPDYAQGIGQIIDMDNQRLIARFDGYSIPIQVTDWKKVLQDGRIFPVVQTKVNQSNNIPTKNNNKVSSISSTVNSNQTISQKENYRIYPTTRPNAGHIPTVKFWNHIFPSILLVSIDIFGGSNFIVYVAALWIGAWIRHKLFYKKFSMSIICRAKGWQISKGREIKINSHLIGVGEDELYNKILNSEIEVLRQVKIDKYYKADFICFNHESKKLCVVEVDGHQHFNDQEQIDKDNLRMSQLANLGVPTIRFFNEYAKTNPMVCTKLIIDLLK
ncbi:MAG: dual OB domain-containing protein [Pseudanabaena sp.]